MNNLKKINGFTLIELAMVLFILGLLLTSILPPLASRIESEERNETQIQLDEIEEVLYGFALGQAPHRLPCPDCRAAGEGTCVAADVDDGAEDVVVATGECKTEVGNLPWVTLGIKATDAWGQYFTYRVTESFADTTDGTGPCGTATMNVSFELCSSGNINIIDADGGANIATNVPAIVVSHGKNWTETPTDHEEENYDNGLGGDTLLTFVDKEFSDDATEGFDDLLFWISPHVLNNKMVQAGILP